MSFMRELDFYGIPFNFTLFNKSVYKTTIGGIMSMLTLVCFVLCFIYFTTDFYMRQNPRYINQEDFENEYPLNEIKDNSIFFAIRIDDENGLPFDWKKYFDIELSFSRYQVNKSSSSGNMDLKEYKLLPYMNCNDYDMKKMRLDSKKNFTTFSCIDLNNLSLGGSWSGDYVNYVYFGIRPCNNITNKDCKNFDELFNLLKSHPVYLSMYTNTYSLQITDYDNPLIVNEGLFYYTLNNYIGKRVFFYYRKGTVNQDMGIISPVITNYTVFGIDHVDYDNFYYQLGDNNPLIESYIYFTNKKEQFKIIYLKLQEALANVGGILNFILLFFSKITGIFNEHERSLQIVNELFDFSDFNDQENLNKIIEKDGEQLKNVDNTKLKNLNNNGLSFAKIDQENKLQPKEISKDSLFSIRNEIVPFQINKEIIEPKMLEDVSSNRLNNEMNDHKVVEVGVSNQLNNLMFFQKIIEEIEKYNENKKPQYFFRISLFLLIRNVICNGTLSKRDKFFIKMFKKSQEIVNRQMDVIDYLKFINEYTFVKCLLFSYPQNLCLKFIEKPKLYSKSRFTKLQGKSDNKILKRKIDLIKYFQSQSEVNEKDQVFYDLLSEEIKQIIKK